MDAKELLVSSQQMILTNLKLVLANGRFNYRTFGVDIEEYVCKELISIFTSGGFIHSVQNYHLAEDKNEFPDFTLLSVPPLAIEVKSGNHYRKSNGVWVGCKNSENDMGTLNVWQEKLSTFGGDNIYYVLIEYALSDNISDILKVTAAPFYKFIGLNSDGLLKYREKDGNLRPKDFDQQSPIQTFHQFQSLFSETEIYRAKRIIKKHIQTIPDSERNSFLDSLKL